MTLKELVERARASGDWGPLSEAVPYARWLGIAAFTDAGGDELLGKLSFTPKIVGNASIPALHGGTLGALLESTAVFQLLYEADTLLMPRTITITIDYLRSARPVDTFARGVITRQGRRVASVHAEAWQEDRARPVATATVHLLLRPHEPGP